MKPHDEQTNNTNQEHDALRNSVDAFLDVLVTEWEDALASVHYYLNEDYENHIPQLCDAMKRAVIIDDTITLARQYLEK